MKAIYRNKDHQARRTILNVTYVPKTISQALVRHTNYIHKGLKMHQCKLCDKAYSDPTPLKNHMKTFHTQKGSYECDKCNKIFPHEFKLKVHYRRSHITHHAWRDLNLKRVTSEEDRHSLL